MKSITAIVSLLLWSVAAFAEMPPTEFNVVPATPALIAQLRAGGFVLYMRHGATDTLRPDAAVIDVNDCNTQRPLTTEGRALAAHLGEMVRKARIPYYEVVASPLCRAKESAAAAFTHFTIDQGLMYTANMTKAEKAPRLAATRAQLSRPVPADTNRIIVAHAPNVADLIGYFPNPEGTVVVFRPLGEGRFEYVASIVPKQWPDLIK